MEEKTELDSENMYFFNQNENMRDGRYLCQFDVTCLQSIPQTFRLHFDKHSCSPLSTEKYIFHFVSMFNFP